METVSKSYMMTSVLIKGVGKDQYAVVKEPYLMTSVLIEGVGKDRYAVVEEHVLHLLNLLDIVEEITMEILCRGYNLPRKIREWVLKATRLKKKATSLQTQQNTKNVSPKNDELDDTCYEIYNCMKACPIEDVNDQPMAFLASMYRIEDGSKTVPSPDSYSAEAPKSTRADEIVEEDDAPKGVVAQENIRRESDPNDEVVISGKGVLQAEKNTSELDQKFPIPETGEMFKDMNVIIEVSSSSSQETSNLNSVCGLGPDDQEKYLFSVKLEKEGQIISSPPEYLIAAEPNADKWREAAVVKLIDNKVLSLSGEPACPNLVLLFLQRNNQLTSISSNFFNQMPALRFLDCSETRIRDLPSSLFCLTNLEVLMLRSCACLEGLPEEVKKLTNMKVLDLSGTDLYNVPKEIDEVKSLRLLHLQFYRPDYGSEYDHLPSELIQPGAMDTLQDLESLSIVVHPEDQRWKDVVGEIIKYVGTYKKLSYLHFYFPTLKALQNFTKMSPSWEEKRLTKFNFIVGNNVKRIISRVPSEVESKYNEHDKCLRFVNGNEVVEEVKTTLGLATAFYLDHHLEAKSLSDFGISNFKELKFCVVRECPKLEFFITLNNGDPERSESAFPNLEYLGLHYLWELKQIWEDALPSRSFKALTYLMVGYCHKLEYIASDSTLKCLSSLKTFIIEDCESLKSIVKDKESVKHGHGALLPQLTELKLRHLPQLVAPRRGTFPSGVKVEHEDCPMYEATKKWRVRLIQDLKKWTPSWK